MSNIIQEMSTLSMKDYIIKNHELDKFKLLYLENAPRLIFYASKYVDSDTAEDLVHDIFIKIWQKKEIYSVEEGLKTYLFRSVQNACLDYLKHKSIEMTYADEVARRLKIEEIGYYNQSDAAESGQNTAASCEAYISLYGSSPAFAPPSDPLFMRKI